MREEGHYTIKRVNALPDRGNSNLLYLLIGETPITKFNRWNHGVWEELPLSSIDVPTALSIGTVNATTFGITSDGGADDIILPEADTDDAGLLGAAKWDEIVANTARHEVKTVKVSLNAAEVKALGTTPIDAIATPGAGAYIKVLRVEYSLTWGAAIFDANALEVAYDSGATIGLSTMTLDVAADSFNSDAIVASHAVHVNTKVVITGTDSVATGDSVVDVYITYEIITV